jgi:hypothetical protein
VSLDVSEHYFEADDAGSGDAQPTGYESSSFGPSDREGVPVPELDIVAVEDFVAVDEPGATALLGDGEAALIPEDGDVMVYGDGGAGKTTLCIDLAFHLAAGDEWLGVNVARPVRVLLIENEGPRPLFRRKLRRKLEGWHGSALGGRVEVFTEPWGEFAFTDPACQQTLATKIREREIDVVFVGPVTRSGMEEAGTLQEVRDFMMLVAGVRRLAERRVAFILIHHENKGGKVSGAWEGSGDTLLHVSAQGNGRTRLYVQKARWSSAHHAATLHLRWTGVEGFELEEAPELDDETLAEMLLAAIRENPGLSWTRVEEATPGVSRERRRNVRDGLFVARRILNVVKEQGVEVTLRGCPERRPSRLYPADDPSIAHLRPDPGAVAAQTAPAPGVERSSASAPCAHPIGGRRRSGAVAHPPEPTLQGQFSTLGPHLGDEGYAAAVEAAYNGGHVTADEAAEQLWLDGLVQKASEAAA